MKGQGRGMEVGRKGVHPTFLLTDTENLTTTQTAVLQLSGRKTPYIFTEQSHPLPWPALSQDPLAGLTVRK